MDTVSGRLHAAYPLAGDVVRGLDVTPLTGLGSERGVARLDIWSACC